MNIIVLAGGKSTEREVSIVTGTKVCEALRSAGHNAAVLDVYFGTKNTDVFGADYNLDKAVSEIKECSARLEEEKSKRKEFFGENVIALCQKADIVFMALHGENGENGKVQAAFDLFGIKYTGTGYLGSAIAMDKGVSKSIFTAKGIPTPKGISLKKSQVYQIVEQNQGKDMLGVTDHMLEKANITLPCIVKPSCGGSSIGVTIVNKEEELKGALEEAFRLENEVIIEKYVSGREFSVGVVDGEAYPIIEIVPKEGFYDYTNKYEPGKTDDICPANLTKEQTAQMQSIAVDVSKALFLDKYCRVDFIMDSNGGMYCLEANTLPGMTPTSLLPQEALVLGMDYETLCEKLIQVSVQ